MYKETEIQIFIHYPGQLIRSFEIPLFTSSFSEYQHDKVLKFKISESSIVIGRADYRPHCNSSMEDYDMHLVHEVIKEIDCIPSYWKKHFEGKLWLEECTSSKQLQKSAAFAVMLQLKHAEHEADASCAEHWFPLLDVLCKLQSSSLAESSFSPHHHH